MSEKPLDYAGFIHLVIGALEAAQVDYLIGGAVAAWAWGKPRATQDVDFVVRVPVDSINRLAQEELARHETCSYQRTLSWEPLLETHAVRPLSAIHVQPIKPT